MRENGYYWVRRGNIDTSQGPWEIARWEGQWWRTEDDVRRADADMAVIGPRLLDPDQTPAAAVTLEMAEAGLSAFRNSSWHELSPTDIDRDVSPEALAEAYEAMEAVRPRGADAPTLWQRQNYSGVWTPVDEEDIAFYRDEREQPIRPLYAGAVQRKAEQ